MRMTIPHTSSYPTRDDSVCQKMANRQYRTFSRAAELGASEPISFLSIAKSAEALDIPPPRYSSSGLLRTRTAKALRAGHNSPDTLSRRLGVGRVS